MIINDDLLILFCNKDDSVTKADVKRDISFCYITNNVIALLVRLCYYIPIRRDFYEGDYLNDASRPCVEGAG